MNTVHQSNPNQLSRIPRSIAALIAVTALSACVPTGDRPELTDDTIPATETAQEFVSSTSEQEQLEFSNFVFSPERVRDLSQSVDELSKQLFEKTVNNEDYLFSIEEVNNKRFDTLMTVQGITKDGIPLYFDVYGVMPVDSEDQLSLSDSLSLPFKPVTIIMYAPNEKGYKYDADAGITLVVSDNGQESYATVYSEPLEETDRILYSSVDGSSYTVTYTDSNGEGVKGGQAPDIIGAIHCDQITVDKLQYFIDQIPSGE